MSVSRFPCHTHKFPFVLTCFERIILLLCQILTNDILCSPFLDSVLSQASVCLFFHQHHVLCLQTSIVSPAIYSSTVCVGWSSCFSSPFKHRAQFFIFLVLTKLLAGTLVEAALNSHIVMVGFVHVVQSRIIWNRVLMRGCLHHLGPWAGLGELSLFK